MWADACVLPFSRKLRLFRQVRFRASNQSFWALLREQVPKERRCPQLSCTLPGSAT